MAGVAETPYRRWWHLPLRKNNLPRKQLNPVIKEFERAFPDCVIGREAGQRRDDRPASTQFIEGILILASRQKDGSEF